MTSEQKQQFTYRITNANSTEMIVILYDMVLCYSQEGEQAHDLGDEAGFREAIRKMRGCFNELLHSLDLNYEPAASLSKLYYFCIRRLARCEFKKESTCFAEINKIIKPLRDAYRQIAGENRGGAVMGNSQVVYAGLTYGKNQLSEDMADQGSNRGMFA